MNNNTEYTVNGLAELSGISTRTLRYYDSIGLLKPMRLGENGYRYYGTRELDLLQQILFFRELGMSLEEIGEITGSPDFDRKEALNNHLLQLSQKKERLEELIENVSNTLKAMNGGITMSDSEKFKGFKKELIEQNEKKYGKEIRTKYGDAAIDESNARLAEMTEREWSSQEELSAEINRLLAIAVKEADPAGKTAQTICALHEKWIKMFWGEPAYSREAHKQLGESYVADERFKKYYDAIAPGAAELLRDALNIYCA